MKFKVKEKYTVMVWNYIDADTLKEARQKLEDGKWDNPDFDNPISEDYEDIFWDTLQEWK